jgi:Uma2 family endonuclease
MRDTHLVPSPMTVDEYLAFEEASPERHEYIAGVVYLMSGASGRHNLISSNILTALRGSARRRGCRVYIEGVKLRAAQDRIYYPDVMVVCRELEGDETVLEDPSLVVEVASTSTRATDRREKLAAYRAMPSLEAYLIVEQRRRLVTVHWRVQGGEWQGLELVGDGDIPLPFLGTTLTLDQIYDDVPLPPLRVGEETDELAVDEDDGSY